MKTVQDKDGNIVEVTKNTPCHAGKDGNLPIMLDPILDAGIFAEMAEREIKHAAKMEDYRLNKEYKEKRRKELASVEDQLDMLYEDMVNGTTTFKDHRDELVNKYPKPSK